MKTSLEHLPAKKQRELDHIQAILLEEFRAAVTAKPPRIKKPAEVLKIVLFGSYARGDWVDEKTRSRPNGYQSDFDLLVVVSHKDLADTTIYWRAAEERLLRATSDATPFSLIVHSLGEVNSYLERGRPFFLDIVRDGILLYDSPGHPFRKPKLVDPVVALQEAQDAFEEWHPFGDQFYDDFVSNLERSRFKKATLELHQGTECFYTAYLLVKTSYVPKTHNLNVLRSLAEGEDARFRAVWPAGVRGGRRAYQRLKDGYVKARYSRHYEIEREELVWLGERVAVLRDLAEELCEERIASLRAEVKAAK